MSRRPGARPSSCPHPRPHVRRCPGPCHPQGPRLRFHGRGRLAAAPPPQRFARQEGRAARRRSRSQWSTPSPAACECASASRERAPRRRLSRPPAMRLTLRVRAQMSLFVVARPAQAMACIRFFLAARRLFWKARGRQGRQQSMFWRCLAMVLAPLWAAWLRWKRKARRCFPLAGRRKVPCSVQLKRQAPHQR